MKNKKTVNCINFCANERVNDIGNGSISQNYDMDGEFLMLTANEIDEAKLPKGVKEALKNNFEKRLTAEALKERRMAQAPNEHTL